MIMDHVQVLNELIKRVKDHNISISYTKHISCLGQLEYDCSTKKFLIICRATSVISKISVLAHEFGHFLDFDLNGDEYHEHVTNLAGLSKIVGKVYKQVVAAEIQAWDYADAILTEIGFDVGDRRYKRMKKRCLDSYKNFCG